MKRRLKLDECLRLDRSGGLDEYICDFMYDFIVNNNIKKVLETGISWGFASTCFLDAVGDGGNLVSIEYQLMSVGSRVVPLDFYNRWTIVEGKSRDVLKDVLDKYKPFDLFWHDSSHSYVNQMFEYESAFNCNCVKFIGSHDIYARDRSAWDVFISKHKNEIEVIKQDNMFGLAKVLR